jgi:putative membrane protein
MLLFALLVTLFAVQNAQDVPIKFFTYDFSSPLSVIIIGSVSIGALFIGLLWLIRHIRLSMKLREAKDKIKKGEALLKEMGETEKALIERIKVLEERLNDGVKEESPGESDCMTFANHDNRPFGKPSTPRKGDKT